MTDNVEYLYYDKKGKPCTEKDAALCVMREKDKNGKVIKETEIEIFDEEGK